MYVQGIGLCMCMCMYIYVYASAYVLKKAAFIVLPPCD